MKINFLLLLVLIPITFGLIGCSEVEETDEKDVETKMEDQSHHSSHSFDVQDITKDDVIGHIGGVKITGEDLLYEMKRLELIYALGGDNIEASPSVAIQEFTRNQMIHQIATEQNITIAEQEQQERALAVKKDVTSNDAYKTVMEGIDEEDFWKQETERYKVILEAEELITILKEELKKDHPDYTEQALRFDAQEELDEWIQEKITETDIHIEKVVN